MSQFNIDQSVREICDEYEKVIRNIDNRAKEDASRAYGGVVRMAKGQLLESIAEQMVKAAWQKISQSQERLTIDSQKISVPIQKNYIMQIKDAEVKKYISDNVDKFRYNISVDKHVYIDTRLVMGIECKSYTENAMLKRILVDFNLLKIKHPDISCYLFQLESFLGGDYASLKEPTFGSPSSHTLQSYFSKVKLNIHTFVAGDRNIDKPIHKPEFYKPINKQKIKEAIFCLSDDLGQYK